MIRDKHYIYREPYFGIDHQQIQVIPGTHERVTSN
jgi:hypothetical protein